MVGMAPGTPFFTSLFLGRFLDPLFSPKITPRRQHDPQNLDFGVFFGPLLASIFEVAGKCWIALPLERELDSGGSGPPRNSFCLKFFWRSPPEPVFLRFLTTCSQKHEKWGPKMTPTILKSYGGVSEKPLFSRTGCPPRPYLPIWLDFGRILVRFGIISARMFVIVH